MDDLKRTPASNSISSFSVGFSPIGTEPQFDWHATVISQYANSPIILKLIEAFFAVLDQTKNFDAFYDHIWNVDTAEGYGLDVWGRIVAINRAIEVQTVGRYFGFEEATDASGFNQDQFYDGRTSTSNFVLLDPAYRTLVLAKALSNISSATIPVLNKLLMTLFPNRGHCYVTDGQDYGSYFGFAEAITSNGFNQEPFNSEATIKSMQMTYTFEFQLTPLEVTIVKNSGVLPRPDGVKAEVVINA